MGDQTPPDDDDESLQVLLGRYVTRRTTAARRPLELQIFQLTMPLADRAAHRYRNRGVDIDDLEQVARLALLKAIRGYQPGRGNAFAAYALPTVTGELKKYFRDCGWVVRPPRHLQEARARLTRPARGVAPDPAP